MLPIGDRVLGLDFRADDVIHQCGNRPLEILQNCRLACTDSSSLSTARQYAELLIDLADSKFHSYKYSEVPYCWRRLYTDASIYGGYSLIALASVHPSSTSPSEAVMMLDKASIVAGAPGHGRRELIDDLLSMVSQQAKCPASHLKEFKIYRPDYTVNLEKSVVEHYNTTPWQFQDLIQTHNNPILLKGAIMDWPAIQKWRDPQFFLDITNDGSRIVPIEVGSKYTDRDWSQKLVPFKVFLNEYVMPSDSKKIGYLAQYDIFKHIPGLRQDIDIPEFCFVDAPGKYASPDEIICNIWFGPGGTVSPLHHDPYSNILCQVNA